MMPLILAAPGEENIIRKVGGSPEMRQHLAGLGFVAGGAVTVVSTIAGNLIVNVKDTRVAISREMAGRIDLRQRRGLWGLPEIPVEEPEERSMDIKTKIRLAPTVRQQFRKHATRGCRLTGPERQQPFSTSRGAAVIFSEADLSGDLLRRRCRNRQLCADELTELRQRKGRAGKRNTPAYRKRYTDVFL